MKWFNNLDEVTQFVIIGWGVSIIYYGAWTAALVLVCFSFFKVGTQ